MVKSVYPGRIRKSLNKIYLNDNLITTKVTPLSAQHTEGMLGREMFGERTFYTEVVVYTIYG